MSGRLLDNAPTIDPAKYGEWIPCKKRLPDKKGEYLCTIQYTTWNGKVDRGIFSGYYTKTDGWRIGEGIVIAWMPLPESYKEMDEDVSHPFADSVMMGGEEQRMTDLISRQQDERFTDKEKRIFLAAMGRELDICKEVDRELPTREAYEDTLESVCREITRKVKGALWT